MPEPTDLPHGGHGQPILPAHDAVVDALNKLARNYAADYDNALPDEARLLPNLGTVVCEQFLGIVRVHPCDSEGGPDYPDCRYYLDRYAINAGTLDTDEEFQGLADTFPDPEPCITAINLAELPPNSVVPLTADTHRIPIDTVVNVFAVYSNPGPDGSPPIKHYVFFHQPAPLHFGKIQTVPACYTYAIVKECDATGTRILSNTLITVVPTPGQNSCTQNGFCYVEGDVIAYIPSPNDKLLGYQVGAYKSVSVGMRCSDSNSASVPGLNRITFYNSDFFVLPSSDCGGTYTNVANIFWRGMVVKAYGGMGGSVCGAPDATSTGGVKVLNFDMDYSGGRSFGGTDARIAFNLQGCATTTANVPTIGGGPCNDESSPVEATVLGFLPTTVGVKSIDGATAVCNEDGTITVTINYSTHRVCVAFT